MPVKEDGLIVRIAAIWTDRKIGLRRCKWDFYVVDRLIFRIKLELPRPMSVLQIDVQLA